MLKLNSLIWEYMIISSIYLSHISDLGFPVRILFLSDDMGSSLCVLDFSLVLNLNWFGLDCDIHFEVDVFLVANIRRRLLTKLLKKRVSGVL